MRSFTSDGEAHGSGQRQVVTVDGEIREGRLQALDIRASAGEGAKRVADDAAGPGPLHVGLGVLAVRRAGHDGRASSPDQGPEHFALEIGVVNNHQHVGRPVAEGTKICREL